MSTTQEWRIRRPATGETDTDLFDTDPLREAFNRFANGGNLPILDDDGTKIDDYPYGTRVEVQYTENGGSTWTTRLAGLALDRNRTLRRGVPMLEVGMVGYDHLLRRRKVYKTYTSETISTILEDLITTFTSVNWVAGNVSVQNDETLTREFQGERVDECIAWLASVSADEEFGVDDSLEFFFRQQSVSSAAPLGPEDIIDHDLPQKGTRAINWFRLYYGSGGSESFVTVQDPEAQKALQDKTGAPRPVIVADSDTRPEISNEDAAKGIAEQKLGERSDVLQGTVTTFGRFDTDAGDVVTIDLPEAGVNNVDFRVAQVEYYWQRGETVLTIAENSEGIDDLLVALSDSVANDRARDADTTVTGTDFLAFESGAEFTVSATIIQLTAADDALVGGFETGEEGGFERSNSLGGFRFSARTETTETVGKATEDLLNMARDVWQGKAATDVTHLALGTDSEAASVTDDGLGAEVERVDLSSAGGSGSTAIAYVSQQIPPGGTLSGTQIGEVSVSDSDTGGTDLHYARASFEDGPTHSETTIMTVSLTVTIDDDPALQGVLTATGQERLRDLLIGETNHEPSSFVYGTGTTDPAESDTSLGTQVHEDTIDSSSDLTLGVCKLVERIGTGEANSNDLTELGQENAANELLSRIVFAQYPKTSNAALETIHQWAFSNA